MQGIQRDSVMKSYDDFVRAENKTPVIKKITFVMSSVMSGLQTAFGCVRTTLCCRCLRAGKAAAHNLFYQKVATPLVELHALLKSQSSMVSISEEQIINLLGLTLGILQNTKEFGIESLSTPNRAIFVALAHTMAALLENKAPKSPLIHALVMYDKPLLDLIHQAYHIVEKERQETQGILTRATDLANQFAFDETCKQFLEPTLGICKTLLEESSTGLRTISFQSEAQFIAWKHSEPLSIVLFGLSLPETSSSEIHEFRMKIEQLIPLVTLSKVKAGEYLDQSSIHCLTQLKIHIEKAIVAGGGALPKARAQVETLAKEAEGYVPHLASAAVAGTQEEMDKLIQSVPSNLISGLFS